MREIITHTLMSAADDPTAAAVSSGSCSGCGARASVRSAPACLLMMGSSEVDPGNAARSARELGADYALNGAEVDVVEEIGKATGAGTHYAVETTGVPAVVHQSLAALRPLGTVAIVGITPEMTVDMFGEIMAEGKTVTGVIEGDTVPQLFIPELVEYYRQGRFPFDKLVKYYDFEDINQAFEDSRTGKTIKPVVKMR